MSETTTIKLKVRSYLGAVAESGELKLPGGKRLTEIHWIDKAVGQPYEFEAGTVVLRVVSGDGRYPAGHPKAMVEYAHAFTNEAGADAARAKLIAEWS